MAKRLLKIFGSRQTPDAYKSAIMEVLNGLPILETKKDTIPSVANDIYGTCAICRLADVPNATKVTRAKSSKELEQFAKLAMKLHSYVSTMSSSSVRRLEDNKMNASPAYLQSDLEAMILETFKPNTLPDSDFADDDRGRRSEYLPKALIENLANIYESLTGTKPTRIVRENKDISPFVEFAVAMFKALDMPASAESRVREHFKDLDKKAHEIG